VDGRDFCPECFGGSDAEDWITRSLRAMHADEPGYDPELAMERFREGVRRMETDPEYAAYIRRLAEEADMDLAANETVTVELTSPEVPEMHPGIRQAFHEAMEEAGCAGLTADPDGPEPAP
jgi:hypothetical protein